MNIKYREKLVILLSKVSNSNVLDIKKEIDELEDWAYKDPTQFRNVRHDIQSGNYLRLWGDHPLYKYADKYGVGSIVFGTYCKIVSIVRVKRTKLRDLAPKKPPAFDHTLRANIEDPMTYDEIISHGWRAIEILKQVLCQWRAEHRYRRVILLNNGSSMGYEVGSIRITDTMSNICTYPSYVETPALSKLVGLLNDRSDNDPFVYLDHDQYVGYNINHNYVPDKDGKIREVYQCSSDVQIISKGLHELFDAMARKLPGNYTYCHKEWIRNIIRNNWNKEKLIITTDMSKYSDTLDRAFILSILEAAGFTDDELKEMDMLYSLPVLDDKNGILKDTKATYQGQYGDFPLITIANLTLQCALYDLLNENMKPGYNAAVGDDTGFIFDYADPKIAKDLIVRLYGSVGVNINEIKTGQLNKGIGACDFVKLTFDKHGLRKYLEYRSFALNNTDQIIRDIYDNECLTNEEKRNYFKIIFGKDISQYLMKIHKINGGLRNDRITVEDVVQLIDNTWSILNDLDINNTSDLYTFLEHARKELNSQIHPVKGRAMGLRDTCLFKFRDRNIPEDANTQLIDDSIVAGVLAISKVGIDRDIDYMHMVGADWKQVEEEARNREDNKPHDPDLCLIYDDIDAFFQLKGKYQDKLKGQASHVYLRHYQEYSSDEYYHKFIPGIEAFQYELSGITDYRESINKIITDYNSTLNYTFNHVWHHNTTSFVKKSRYWYYRHEGKLYRLYDTKGKSNYEKITQEIMDLYPRDFKGMLVNELEGVFGFI